RKRRDTRRRVRSEVGVARLAGLLRAMTGSGRRAHLGVTGAARERLVSARTRVPCGLIGVTDGAVALRRDGIEVDGVIVTERARIGEVRRAGGVVAIDVGGAMAHLA